MARAQTVENVRTDFDQSRQTFYIYYDLKGLNYKKELHIAPYNVLGDKTLDSLQGLSGDLGWIKRGGKNKVVVWDPFKDGVNNLEGIQVRVIASEVRDAAVPRIHGLLLHGSNSAPFGLKYMLLRKTGFYAGFRIGKSAPKYTYTVSEAGAMNYTETGVYEIGDESAMASYAFTAGPTFRVGRNTYVYGGLGYGLEQIFWEYAEFDLNKSFLRSEWALSESSNSKGLAADAGIVFRLGPLLLDAGIGSIAFKSWQIAGGIGFAFGHHKKS
jgi:hypothetical protein